MKKFAILQALAICLTILLATSAFASDTASVSSMLSELIGGLGASLEETAEEDTEAAEEVEEMEFDGDIVALDDLNISVVVEDYASIRQDEDGFVTIYTEEDESIPYIIIGYYDFTADDFVDQFTEYLGTVYDDLDVNMVREGVEFNGREYDLAEYAYTIQGFEAKDSRAFTEINGKTYMFGRKEVEELDLVISDDVFDNVIASCELLAGGYDDYELHVDANTSVLTDGSMETIGGGDDEDNTIYTHVEFKESMAPYAGTWVEFADGFNVYLPSDWVEYEVTDENKANGCLYQAGDKSANADDVSPFIAVNFGDAYGFKTIEEVAEELEYEGYVIEDIVDVNGILCVNYSYTADGSDICGMMFFCPSDPDYVCALVGFRFTKNQELLSAILCSLSPLE